MNYTNLPKYLFGLLLIALLGSAALKYKSITFEQKKLVAEGAEWWWARSHADVNQDGLVDFFVINNNARGGWLGWYETQADLNSAKLHIIADEGPEGGTFASGDLASGDIDNDGDIDVLGSVGAGEWEGGDQPVQVYWYENPSWKPHYLGEFPPFIKDLDLVDLNQDGKLDVAATCFSAHRMVVYRQDSPDEWEKAADVFVETLHEGQHVGDLDGDGDIDVVSTAFWFENPGDDMTGDWTVRNIDPYWNSDEGRSWEYNSTKIFCADIDDDGQDEVFISCSEKFRDRIAWYDSPNPQEGDWTMHEIGKNAFSHTLQVGDVDGDGDYDVLSGNNGDQGDPENSPVILFINQGDNINWEEQVLTKTGAYNSYLADIEGDGDLDFFRYNGHESTFYELWLNQTK
ncbi:FG-GAP-like repeat-containing protein [Tunicatimonas pelagia]|uniref:FG-GAP-like repeat-containing protein n=1 Tax=Tunicatimonas pelagia TaxID=931531 RepID=UPI002665272D|nr:FG-GAP-like repeat-containing protein [Tunicatimonas pelagia]WKN42423.1 FG-GAP-like repeat-containing protein [Tunicatimonas pelagia]